MSMYHIFVKNLHRKWTINIFLFVEDEIYIWKFNVRIGPNWRFGTFPLKLPKIQPWDTFYKYKYCLSVKFIWNWRDQKTFIHHVNPNSRPETKHSHRIHPFVRKHPPNWCLRYTADMVFTQEALLLVLLHVLKTSPAHKCKAHENRMEWNGIEFPLFFF